MMGKKGGKGWDPGTRAFRDALWFLEDVPMLSGLMRHAHVMRSRNMPYPPRKWAVGTSNGEIYVHPTRRAEPAEWVYIIAHCLLHLGFDHFREHERFNLWNAACDFVINGWLVEMNVGDMPDRGTLYDPELKGLFAEAVIMIRGTWHRKILPKASRSEGGAAPCFNRRSPCLKLRRISQGTAPS